MGFRSEKLGREIVDAAFAVHKELGPGLLESVYELCLADELISRGLEIRTQVPVPLVYKGRKLESGFRLDILVDNKIIIELKAVEGLAPVHTAQVLTYLRLSTLSLGFLINFNEALIRDGIKRIVYNYKPF